MRASMAYFAGAGTVIAAIVCGVGGGLLIADMISPKSPKQELTLLERRTPPPIQAVAGASEPVPYLAPPQPSAPSSSTAAAPATTQANTQADNSASTPAPPVDTAAGSKAAVSAAQPATATTQAAAREQTANPQTVTSEEALAKPRDADVKRTTERRRFERRQQRTEKRRYQPRPDQELREVEDRVREETEPRRQFAVEPVRIERPLIRLFGSE
jgi:hypothetical protein